MKKTYNQLLAELRKWQSIHEGLVKNHAELIHENQLLKQRLEMYDQSRPYGELLETLRVVTDATAHVLSDLTQHSRRRPV